MAPVVMAWTLEEKRSKEISANQPESGKLKDDAEATEQETSPQPPEPLPPQQLVAGSEAAGPPVATGRSWRR